VKAKGFYVALDKNLKKIFVLFGSGLKLVYGNKVGEYLKEAICWNIEVYAQIQPPTIPRDSRHMEYEEWLLSNPHLCWPPWARAGVYHWGIWMEQAHKDRGSVLTRDISAIGARVKPVQLILFRSLGALTRAQRIVFVTGRGGTGFHSPGPALTRGRGGAIFRVITAPPPPGAHPHSVPRRGPVCYHPFLAGTRPGYGWGGGLSGDRGRECRKRHPAPGR